MTTREVYMVFKAHTACIIYIIHIYLYTRTSCTYPYRGIKLAIQQYMIKYINSLRTTVRDRPR